MVSAVASRPAVSMQSRVRFQHQHGHSHTCGNASGTLGRDHEHHSGPCGHTHHTGDSASGPHRSGSHGHDHETRGASPAPDPQTQPGRLGRLKAWLEKLTAEQHIHHEEDKKRFFSLKGPFIWVKDLVMGFVKDIVWLFMKLLFPSQGHTHNHDSHGPKKPHHHADGTTCSGHH